MGLSLAELEALGTTKSAGDPPPPPPPPPPIKGGDGTQTQPDLEAERQKQARLAEEQRQQQQKTPEQIAEEQKQANIAAGKNADGTEKTQAQLDADAAELKKQEDEDQDDLALWVDVDKMWGEDLRVEYKLPDGTEVHPNTPDGIFIRERAIEKRAFEKLDRFLEERDARSYAYMLHRQAGGNDEEFFAQKTVTLPEYEKFKESVDLKTKVVTDSLRLKGVPENVIKLTIKDAIENKTLDALAETEYKETDRREKDEVARLNQQNQQQQEQFNRSVQALNKTLTEEMTTGMRVVIPDARRQEFDRFVRERIEWDGSRFVMAQPIEIKSLPRMLDALYFQFAGGSLKELVVREAQTQNTSKLKRHVEASRDGRTSKGDEGGRRKMTLGEI